MTNVLLKMCVLMKIINDNVIMSNDIIINEWRYYYYYYYY